MDAPFRLIAIDVFMKAINCAEASLVPAGSWDRSRVAIGSVPSGLEAYPATVKLITAASTANTRIIGMPRFSSEHKCMEERWLPVKSYDTSWSDIDNREAQSYWLFS
jgi:hypothetical protein